MLKVAIIPVKSKSKRFPGKNFSSFNGTTLINNTVNKLVKAKVDKIIISTDVPEKVKTIITTPPVAFDQLYIYERPDELAQDYSKIEDVILDVIEKTTIPVDEDYIIILAQVTSSNWSPHSLVYAIHKHEQLKYEKTIISVSPNFQPNGAFYIFTKSKFLEYKSIYSHDLYLVDLNWKESTDIDFEYQLYIAEAIARGNYDE